MAASISAFRPGAAAILALLVPVAVAAKPAFDAFPPRTIAVEARPIPSFLPRQPEDVRFGALVYRGGLALRSQSPLFGGLSGLAIDGRGRRLLAISDAGLWLSALVLYDEDGRPAGLDDVRIGPLLGRDGKPPPGDAERDAEALTPAAPAAGGGLGDAVYVGFERRHRIARFPLTADGVGAAGRPIELPTAMRRAPANKGIEALAVLRAGPHKDRLVAMTERVLDDNGHHMGWLFGDGAPKRLALERIGGFDVTGLAALADGGLVVLERRFRWTEGVQMRIRHLRAGEIRPGRRMVGEILVEAGAWHEIDNMEGIAVHEEDGETVITVVSDDNYNPLQRTLLLQFTWPRAAAAGR